MQRYSRPKPWKKISALGVMGPSENEYAKKKKKKDPRSRKGGGREPSESSHFAHAKEVGQDYTNMQKKKNGRRRRSGEEERSTRKIFGKFLERTMGHLQLQ